jgi:hypothetical protein
MGDTHRAKWVLQEEKLKTRFSSEIMSGREKIESEIDERSTPERKTKAHIYVETGRRRGAC